MIPNLKKKNFLKLLDFSPEEIHFLLKLADDLKKVKYAGTEQQRLKGKNIALIFEKTSTRTRCAFDPLHMTRALMLHILDRPVLRWGLKNR